MYSVKDDPKGPGFPIRKSWDQSTLPAPPRLSQAITSFVAYHRQGIHQMHLFAWSYNLKHVNVFQVTEIVFATCKWVLISLAVQLHQHETDSIEQIQSTQYIYFEIKLNHNRKQLLFYLIPQQCLLELITSSIFLKIDISIHFRESF